MLPQIGYQAAHEQFTAQDLVEYGVLAEDAGFEAFVASDHFAPWMDNQGHAGLAWLTLAALGQRTKRIRLGTGVTCPTYRYNPAIVAQAFATLDGLYPGRVFLGVGTGEALNEVPTGGGWGPYPERAARLREAITLTRRLWTEEWVTFKGEFYTLDEAKLYDKPNNPVPIYVAASGPKTARLGGELGDGLISVGGAYSERLDRVQAAFAEGATAAGKDPALLPRICELYVVAGDEEEALEGAELWRHHGGLKGILDIADPRTILGLAREQVDPRQVVGRWVVGRDPDVHIEALRGLGERGFTHVTVHSPQADQRRFIEFYGREVLPALR
jgi:F420-dependent hydroxymycolic acid dehydrogenase